VMIGNTTEQDNQFGTILKASDGWDVGQGIKGSQESFIMVAEGMFLNIFKEH